MNSVMRPDILARLNRDQSGCYGSRKYAFEELVAELIAAFGCASLGIVPTVRHADYIGAWLDVLREDNRAIVRAASQASKAADYLLGLVSETALGAAKGRSWVITKRRDAWLPAAAQE